MDAPKQTETSSPTPEQLLRLLDLQLEMERSKRASKSRNRASFLASGVIFIIAGALVALIVGRQMLEELRDRSDTHPISEEVQEGR